MSAPQRLLYNGRNLLRDAVLAATSVLAVSNKVLPIPTARSGRGAVEITGDYTGTEQIDIDVEIVDTDVEVSRISAPIATGSGSATLTDIEAATADTYTVECGSAGTAETKAAVLVEGVTVSARATGAAGNLVRISVDQSELVFTATAFSLLTALPAGAGSETTPMLGAGFEWDCAVLDARGQIPEGAHRVAFGDDTSAIYVSFKAYVGGVWTYRLAPALARALPAGTAVKFVTGARTVSLTDGTDTESFTDIVTAFDLLDVLRTDSQLVSVDGVVAPDRSPTGQAARELTLRTDAHNEPSTGSGGPYATGLVDVTVNPAVTATELITVTCFGNSSRDHPLAGLGREIWDINGSLSGNLGHIFTGDVYTEPTGKFGFTIPRKLPPGYGVQKGRFSVTSISRPRDAGEEAPSICVNPLALGPEAVDQTLTLVYTKRPSGDCNCDDMPAPALNPRCLGSDLEQEGDMEYSAEAITRLKQLYDFAADVRGRVTKYITGFATDGIPETSIGVTGTAPATGSRTLPGGLTVTLPDGVVTDGNFPADIDLKSTGFADEAMPPTFQECIDAYERALIAIDPVTDTTLRADGFTQWDAALTVISDDLNVSNLGVLNNRLGSIAIEKYKVELRKAIAYAGVSPLGKSDASSLISGDGCWQDVGGDYWWVIKGSVKGGYAPVFTNVGYTSSRDNGEGKFYSTREFGFGIMVKCPERLRVGDTIELAIGDAAWGVTYQIGDQLTLPIIAAGPLYLSGGQDASPVQNWYVTGAAVGPLPVYAFNPDAPVAYSGVSGLAFLIVPGGIPSAKGDAFRFAVEGGHWRYRIDGGAWIEGSPTLNAIDAGPVTLQDGLSIEFLTGAAPSFVAGDRYSFRALQPWATSNIATPRAPLWKWDGASATLSADFGSVQSIDTIALIHDLPDGATITVNGGDAAANEWTESLTWREGSVWSVVARTARYVDIVLGSATGGSIRYAFVGTAVRWSLTADWNPRRVYAIDRATAGLLQGGAYRAKAISGELDWSRLNEAEVADLEAMVDYVKARGDEPVLLIPQTSRTADPLVFAHVNSDDVEFRDERGYQPDAAHERRHSARIPLSGAWR